MTGHAEDVQTACTFSLHRPEIIRTYPYIHRQIIGRQFRVKDKTLSTLLTWQALMAISIEALCSRHGPSKPRLTLTGHTAHQLTRVNQDAKIMDYSLWTTDVSVAAKKSYSGLDLCCGLVSAIQSSPSSNEDLLVVDLHSACEVLNPNSLPVYAAPNQLSEFA